jgi:hypothetical protein
LQRNCEEDWVLASDRYISTAHGLGEKPERDPTMTFSSDLLGIPVKEKAADARARDWTGSIEKGNAAIEKDKSRLVQQ